MTDTPHIDAVGLAVGLVDEQTLLVDDFRERAPRAALRALLSPEITEQWGKAISESLCLRLKPGEPCWESGRWHPACAVAAIQQAIRTELER